MQRVRKLYAEIFVAAFYHLHHSTNAKPCNRSLELSGNLIVLTRLGVMAGGRRSRLQADEVQDID